MSIKDGGPVPLTFADVMGRQRDDYAEAARLRKEELRDHFAGLAMAALLSTEMHANTDSDIISGWAYAQADSMLRAREADQ